MKISIKKIFLKLLLICTIASPTLFLVSCSAASQSQVAPKIQLNVTGGNTYFNGKSFSFIPTREPVFFKDNIKNDMTSETEFIDYWFNFIAPSFTFAMSAISLDSAQVGAHLLSNTIANTPNRDASFNYAISNSWVSGSEIYSGESYRFKTAPFQMDFVIDQDIPTNTNGNPIINGDATLSGLSFKFGYFNINNGEKFDSLKAVSQLNDFFGINDIKAEYTVNLNLSIRTTYKVLFTKDDTPVETGRNFDDKTMKVDVQTESSIGAIVPKENIILEANFPEWLKDNKKIPASYKNLITKISSI